MSITYRPSLTLDEIQFILGRLSCDAEHHAALRRKLEVFTLKAQHGITKASHVKVGRSSKAAELGFEDDETITTLLDLYSNPESRELLSVRQMAKINHHRYVNDMMTPEEEKQYEAAQ
jgi:hypothetical protein